MNNTQLYFAIGLPCLTIIASLIVSLVQLSGLKEAVKETRDDMKATRTELNTKMDMLLAKFYEHDTDLALLKDKTKHL